MSSPGKSKAIFMDFKNIDDTLKPLLQAVAARNVKRPIEPGKDYIYR